MSIALLMPQSYINQPAQEEEISSLGYKLTVIVDERVQLVDCTDYEVAIGNALFTHNDISRFTNLRFVQLTSAGLDKMPLMSMRQRKIVLSNARGVYSIPMAEWVILKILELYKRTCFFYENQRHSRWEKQRDILELYGKTVGIVGMGSIGQEVAKRLHAFSAKVIAFDVFNPHCPYASVYHHISTLRENVGSCDILVLTLPLTEQTYHLCGADLFSQMHDRALLINVSRGGIINEQDLLISLGQGKFGGVALDVFEEEPLSQSSPLWEHPDVLISPHNSFVSDNSHARMSALIYENLRRFVAGQDLLNTVQL